MNDIKLPHKKQIFTMAVIAFGILVVAGVAAVVLASEEKVDQYTVQDLVADLNSERLIKGSTYADFPHMIKPGGSIVFRHTYADGTESKYVVNSFRSGRETVDIYTLNRSFFAARYFKYQPNAEYQWFFIDRDTWDDFLLLCMSRQQDDVAEDDQ